MLIDNACPLFVARLALCRQLFGISEVEAEWKAYISLNHRPPRGAAVSSPLTGGARGCRAAERGIDRSEQQPISTRRANARRNFGHLLLAARYFPTAAAPSRTTLIIYGYTETDLLRRDLLSPRESRPR